MARCTLNKLMFDIGAKRSNDLPNLTFLQTSVENYCPKGIDGVGQVHHLSSKAYYKVR